MKVDHLKNTKEKSELGLKFLYFTRYVFQAAYPFMTSLSILQWFSLQAI
jgi:hypothetical protein